MIFDDIADFEDTAEPQGNPMSVHRLLGACAKEASHIATGIEELDVALGRVLHDDRLPGAVLQRIDLIRQEAMGLAAVLERIANAPALDHILDIDALSQLLTLRAQHARISMR